jgi:hypothetical protein
VKVLAGFILEKQDKVGRSGKKTQHFLIPVRLKAAQNG